jgi:threonylcarbamoyladenosine tRNA methylthiotransferase MtaB
MPQIRGDVRRERAARLRAAGETALRRYFGSQLGNQARILIERVDDAMGFGHSAHFAPVQVVGAVDAGRLVEARITGHNDRHLLAEAA